MSDDSRLTGSRIRREVLGDAHVDRAEAATTAFSATFQDFITRTAWGDVWARPGLDRRMRSALTLAVLTALRAEGEIAMHVRAAIGNGLTPAEIAEILLHATVYAGLPAGNAAMTIAGRTLAEMGLSADRTDTETHDAGSPSKAEEDER
jgi:4-carboxymuconolactone decarboxylase